ncbi:hypothetical protein TSTA_073230 [Talaromyces stipitatus ATCC 10500]|uniref:Uncharacterized protein n=1 Tax=Talaromyces stipitatus (strain ATCC 10500 / CBS 375.48 / QM 6759 / NRRL 1006) TaxID=441959 RepID=B8LUS6_TALSN|nr:uncharacterized protein TSTA_073230 [Talaromyces stipitatus ATCC 10500]EED23933.1 hypothetical protein TSTA_073230 [Talaromyces stipitatus ATCC 10500]
MDCIQTVFIRGCLQSRIHRTCIVYSALLNARRTPVKMHAASQLMGWIREYLGPKRHIFSSRLPTVPYPPPEWLLAQRALTEELPTPPDPLHKRNINNIKGSACTQINFTDTLAGAQSFCGAKKKKEVKKARKYPTTPRQD